MINSTRGAPAGSYRVDGGVVGSDLSVYMPLSTGISASADTCVNILIIYLGTEFILSLDFLPHLIEARRDWPQDLGNKEIFFVIFG